jgi:transposase-like protein
MVSSKRVRRKFTDQFNREVVEFVVQSKFNQPEIFRKYNIYPVLISIRKVEYNQG